MLETTHPRGWLTGFNNLLTRENRKWWHTRRWWMQILVWLLVLNGFVFFSLHVMPGMLEEAAEMDDSLQQEDIDQFRADIPASLFGLAALALPVGVIILTQSQVLAEKRSGVAAWILSKPVARAAYLLAKLVIDFAGFLLIMIALQFGLAYVQLSTSSVAVNAGDFLLATALLILLVSFYQAFTLMMSVLASSTEMVLGASFGLLLGGVLVKDALAGVLKDVVFLTPWALPDSISIVMRGGPLPDKFLLPIFVTPLLTAVCLGVMFWRFRQQEL